MRFWEPDSPGVIIGYGNDPAREVRLDVCRERKIPVFRRYSGGGTVVQGHGCLNFSLILPMNADPRLLSAGGTNAMILGRHAEALQPLIREETSVRGSSDLTIGSRKFSGNAQRRLQRYLLFHGCFLLNLDLTLVGALLPMPSKEPAYRAGRTHAEFLCNLHTSSSDVKRVIRAAWKAESLAVDPPIEVIQQLARERYANPSWTFRER